MNFRLMLSDGAFWMTLLWGFVLLLAPEWGLACLDRMFSFTQAQEKFPGEVVLPLLGNIGNWLDVPLCILLGWMNHYSSNYWTWKSALEGVLISFLITWPAHIVMCMGAGGPIHPDAFTYPMHKFGLIPNLKPAGVCHFFFMFTFVFCLYMFFFGPASRHDPGASFQAALVVAILITLHVLISTVQPKLYVGDRPSLGLFAGPAVVALLFVWFVRIQYMRPPS